jgi:peptide/nickel transport system substrate-binding protein
MNGRHARFVWRLAGLFLVGVLAAGTAWGVSESLASAASPSPSPSSIILRVGLTVEPDNLNPFIGFANFSYEIYALNYDLLFRISPSMQPTPSLAAFLPTRQNGGISANGLVWTIHIRPHLKWSDGAPLTASDVAFTYNYIIRNKMANFTLATVDIERARAIDPTTVQIICSRPKADMENLFIPIVPEHIWRSVSPQAAQSTYTEKFPIVGSGPFITVAWDRGSYLRMVRNPYWWGPKPAVQEIYFLDYQNPDTMVSDLRSGAIDAAWGIPEAQFRALGALKGVQAVAYNEYNWDYLNFNCYTGAQSGGNPVLRDWRFRHALNYAVDHAQLCHMAYDGLALPGTTMINPNTWSNPDYHWQPPASQLYTFDLAKASQLLTQAGYKLAPNGERLDKQGRPIILRLWAATDSIPEQIEAKLIAGWFAKLGLKIQLAVMDWGAIWSRVMNYKGSSFAPQFDMYISDWQGYTDPGQDLSCFTTSQIGSTNEPAWSDPRFDALNAEQACTLDLQKRQAIVWQMQQIMYEQTPWMVLTNPLELQAYNTVKWTGWTRYMNGHGGAFFVTPNVDSYLNLRPVTAAVGGTSHVAVVALVVAVVVAALLGLFVWLLGRARRPGEEV